MFDVAAGKSAKPDLRTLAGRVQHALETRGVSGRSIDRAVYGNDKSSGWMTSVRRGKKKPTIDTIERAAAALNVRAAWLAFGDGAMDLAEPEESLLVGQLAASSAAPRELSNFRIAEIYHGKKVPREAVERVQNRMPATTLTPDEIGDLFFEAAREILREHSEKRRARDEAPTETEPAPTVEKKPRKIA